MDQAARPAAPFVPQHQRSRGVRTCRAASGGRLTQRNYAKFMREDGRLNVRLLPRPVYVEMVKRHRSNPAVIDKVYNDKFWLWDLNQAVTKAEAEGREASRSELAAELESGMDDKDWWELT